MTELSRDEEYSIISKNLSSITSFRRFAATKDFEWLQEVKEKLEALISEVKEDYEIKKLQVEELEKKRQLAIEYIANLGLNPEELLTPITVSDFKLPKKAKGKGAKGSLRKAKYRFTDSEGVVKEWSGNGKRPLALQALLDKGHTLDEYLIESVEEKTIDI